MIQGLQKEVKYLEHSDLGIDNLCNVEIDENEDEIEGLEEDEECEQAFQDLNWDPKAPNQVLLLQSVYQGRKPTVFFQYPGFCQQVRDTSRVIPCTEAQLKKIQLRYKMGSENKPFLCVTSSYEAAGFERTTGFDWNGFWGSKKKDLLKKLNPYQKLNHFPGTWNLGRKDLLWMKISRMKRKFPDEYRFVPNTYLLSCEWERYLFLFFFFIIKVRSTDN